MSDLDKYIAEECFGWTNARETDPMWYRDENDIKVYAEFTTKLDQAVDYLVPWLMEEGVGLGHILGLVAGKILLGKCLGDTHSERMGYGFCLLAKDYKKEAQA